ncbi:MAG: hypothetical protein JXB00_09640 [Bacteroidales bacterium]|nr:hypothetical protein [Bacteroidales bacterium]
MIKKKSFKYIILYLFYIILSLVVSNNSFFWDTIQLASRHAHWYYENNFKFFLLPDSIDSGHIPVFGMLLALIWKIFQKSLFVSHLFMLPFLLGILYQSQKIISCFVDKKHRFLVLIIFLIDPTLLSQSILVSPDIALVFFFLFTLHMILKNSRKLILIGIISLSLISMRGMMISVILFFFDLYFNYSQVNVRTWYWKVIKIIQVYIPAGVLTMAYLVYHYIAKGWIGYHEESPWRLCFERVNFTGFIYNIGILGWRLIDFGRLFLWIVFFMIMISEVKKIKADKNLVNLLILFTLLLTILPLSMLFHKYLLAHRYLLPINLIFSIIVGKLIFEYVHNVFLKKFYFALVIIGLITGNLWVYPDKIAQGWDSTLAHAPYYNLRNKMIEYIQQKEYALKNIGTEFPNSSSFKYIDLADYDIGFSKKDFTKNHHIFYSNVMNDFSDDEIDQLKNNWILEKEYRCMQVKVQLYRNPDKPSGQ